MLSNLKPAPKPQTQPFGSPAVEFDGSQGVATTPGLPDGADFNQFLIDAGYPPELYEVVGTPKTSRWQAQTRDGIEWLTSYKFNFKLRTANLDLPALFAAVKKTKVTPVKKTGTNKALVVAWSDTQTGKVDHRGGFPELVLRIAEKQAALEAFCRKEKPSVIYFLNVGDSIEGFESGGNPMRSNDLSLMQQIDAEATFEWDTLTMLAKYAPVVAASVGSNHCQWRSGKVRLGTALDDWGIFIQRQLARYSNIAGLQDRITFFEPQEHDESLALEVGFGSHVIGLVHGHQASKPEGMLNWWRGQSHGDMSVKDASILVSGHYHHLRVTETGRLNGRSRYWIQCPTLDNGSTWYRSTSGDDSDPGLLVFTLTDEPYNGTVFKL